MAESHRDWFGWWAGAQQRLIEQALAGRSPLMPLFGWAQPMLHFQIRQQRALLAAWQKALDAAERYAAGETSAASAATRTKKPVAKPSLRVQPAPAATRVATKPARPARRRATARDDLKQIAGIGPVLEEKLNAEGIRTFAQLAGLSPAEVERLEAKVVRFPGRITRENWIGQAGRLAKD